MHAQSRPTTLEPPGRACSSEEDTPSFLKLLKSAVGARLQGSRRPQTACAPPARARGGRDMYANGNASGHVQHCHVRAAAVRQSVGVSTWQVSYNF